MFYNEKGEKITLVEAANRETRLEQERILLNRVRELIGTIKKAEYDKAQAEKDLETITSDPEKFLSDRFSS